MKDKATKTKPSECCETAIEPVLSQPALEANARLLTALADPTRLGIINMLASNEGAVCVCDITAQFNKGQPTISHHLGILREAGLVSSTKIGVWAFYQLRRERLSELHQLLDSLYQPLAGRPLNLLTRPTLTAIQQASDASN